MKLKVKATGETLEVAPDSYICGLHPNGNEVEFLAEDVEIIPNDWDDFRMKAAKDILPSIITAASKDYEFESLNKDIWCEQAVAWADSLIKQLKEEK